MDEYFTELNQRQRRFEEAERTNDHNLIGALIAGDDDDTKCYLVDNPNLTNSELLALSKDQSTAVRIELALSKQATPDVLHRLSLDESDIVRVHALCNPLTEYSYFVDVVLHNKFSVAAKKILCDYFRVLDSLEVFESLWRSAKGADALLMNTLHGATYTSYSGIDPNILEFVHEHILSGEASNAVREAYAGAADVALPEILDRLRDDPYRPVINAIARNSSAWVSTHEYLVAKHKSSGIRTSVAMATVDNVLLNRIYHGTKSKEIRFWVEANPVFVSLP